MLRQRPISTKISTIIIICPNAIISAFSVKNCSVYPQMRALMPARAIVIGMDVRRVLNTLLYACSDLPAPTRCPVMICVDIAEAFENIIANEISVLQ